MNYIRLCFYDQVDAVTENEEEFLHPVVSVYLFIKEGYGLTVLIFSFKDPAVSQGIVNNNERNYGSMVHYRFKIRTGRSKLF